MTELCNTMGDVVAVGTDLVFNGSMTAMCLTIPSGAAACATVGMALDSVAWSTGAAFGSPALAQGISAFASGGCELSLAAGGAVRDMAFDGVRQWDAAEAALAGGFDPFSGTPLMW